MQDYLKLKEEIIQVLVMHLLESQKSKVLWLFGEVLLQQSLELLH